MEGGAVGHNFEKDPSSDHLCQVWFNLVQRFQRRSGLNVIFYQNMPNLHNRYKSAERKISQKNPEYMLNYSLPCSCIKIWAHFDLYYSSNGQLKFHLPLFSIFSLVAILVGSRDQRTQIWKRAIQIPFHQSLVAIGPVVSEEKIKVYDVRRTPSDGKSSHGFGQVS